MGLLEKAVTRSRTKDVVEPVAVPGGWDAGASQVVSAIVRGAACSVPTERLTSSTFRGRDTLGIGSALRSAASALWVERLGPRKWSIALGLAAHTYRRSVDWQETFEVVDGPQGRVVRASTPAHATRDGSLVHPQEFRATRELVFAGLRTGRMPSPEAEVAVTGPSVGSPLPPVVALRDGADSRCDVVGTSLAPDAVGEVLDQLPCRVLDRGPAGRTIGVGFRTGSEPVRLAVAVADRGDAREVTMRVVVDPDASEIVRAVGARHAGYLIGAATRALADAAAAAERVPGAATGDGGAER